MHKRIFLPINNNSNILYISKTTVDKDFKATIHSHSNLEILFFINGTGKIQKDDGELNVKKGDVVIINSSIKHCEVSINSLSFYAIGLNNVAIYQAIKDKVIILFPILIEDYSQMLNIFNFIYTEADKKKKGYLELISHQISTIIIFLKRYFEFTYSEIQRNNYSSYISSIIQYIDNFYYLPLNLSDLSSKVSLSIPYICHSFKLQTKMTVFEYKIHKQISEAKNLLKITDMSISQIGLATGFTSISYFTKKFKEIEGITPKQYKKLL